MSGFFEIVWSRPASGLTDGDKAVVLSMAGFGPRALGRLREAAQPMQAGLEAFQGFRFCDLLLSQGEYPEVKKRAGLSLELMIRQNWLLDISVDKLSMGRAHLLQMLEEETDDFSLAEDYLNQAVEGLREAGQQQYLPLGLLAGITLNRVLKNFNNAWADLKEAREIAEQGSMGIYLADYHLETVRLHLAQDQPQRASENFVKAKTMIEEMGCHILYICGALRAADFIF